MRRFHVLVVDDSVVVRNVFREILPNSFELHFGDTGKEGLEIAKIVVPDVILLDLHMPEMNGVELYRHLSADERTKKIPVLVITADDDQSRLLKTAMEGMGLPRGNFLKKPIKKLDDVLPHIIRVCAKSLQPPISASPSKKSIKRGSLTIDLEQRTVAVGENRIDFGVRGPGDKQFAVLCALAQSAEGLTKKELLRTIWNDESDVKTLEVTVSRLRGRLGRDLIVTIPGGYRLPV